MESEVHIPLEETTYACQNCGATVTDVFCATCGQKYPQQRLTMRSLLSLLYESTFDFDRGFFFTLKGLFFRPSQVIYHYLEGRRIVYMNPVKYLLIWLGITTFITFTLLDPKVFTDTMNRQIVHTYKEKPVRATVLAKEKEINDKTQKIQHFLLQNPQFIYALLVPCLSLITCLFFRKYMFTYAEHLLINTYITAQTLCISVPFYFLYGGYTEHFFLVTVISFLVTLIYYGWVMTHFLQSVSYVGTFAKVIVSYLLSYVFLILLFAVAGFMIGLIL